jgi:DNA-binding NarL/FixJ family response regulator
MRALLAPVEVLRQLFDHHTRLIVLAPSPATPRVDTVFTILTSREIDVLTGVGRGDSNKEIARQLHLTPETVKWHLKNVMRKLNADSRARAVANASALGLSLSGEKIAG